MKTPRQTKIKLIYLTTSLCILFMICNQALAQTINIATAADLAKIGNDPNYPLNGNYKQTANINLSGYANWTPIGEFTGTYDGQYYYIDNLTIHNKDVYVDEYMAQYYSISNQGLFSQIGESGEVKNLRMRNVNINLDYYASYIGALAGDSKGKIHRVAVLSGIVRGYHNVGGLVGRQLNNKAKISETYSNATIQGNGHIRIVTLPDPMGGPDIEYSHLSYSLGGLVGINQNDGQVINSYATGNVTAGDYAGGLVGYNTAGSSISQSYASGNVNSPGGLVGLNGGNIDNSYWNITTSGQSTSDGTGAVGKTDIEMKQQATFAGWDFTNIWTIDQGVSQPTLRWLDLSPLPVSLINFTAQAQANQAKLSWQTAQETNNREFIVYRSNNGVNFIELGRVAGAGNSAALRDYYFYDRSPLNGNNYYKLVQVDLDGQETELGIKIISFELPGFSHSLSPNPTDGIVNICMEKGQYHTLTVTDLTGKILQQIEINNDVSNVNISIADYPTGTYVFHLKGTHTQSTEKIIKN